MRIVATGLQFPEGPVAMADGSVLLVEIARQTLTRVTPDGRVEIVAKIPGGPNGAARGPDGRIYVCNNGGLRWINENGSFRPNGPSEDYRGGSIDVVDLATGKVECLYRSCDGNRFSGPNDLVFDAQGGFYFTDIGKRRERDADRGFVYWARADGSEIREVVPRITMPNGIGLSPDGKVLYVAETEGARLWAWDVIGPGALRMRPWPAPYGALLLCDPPYLHFDSLAVAASGNICVTAPEECAIAEIAPNGVHLRRHSVPDFLVSNLCFGGPELRTAFVTLAYRGELLATTWHEPGLRLEFQE
jgi:gluconolactonase